MRDRCRLPRLMLLLPAHTNRCAAKSYALGDPVAGGSVAFQLNETDD